MVGLDGEKMSKSRGNLVFVSRLRRERRRPDGDPAGAARRTTTAATGSGPTSDLAAAETRLARWRDGRVARPPVRRPSAVLDAVRRHLADDLDAPAALAAVDRWADAAVTRGGDDETAPDLVARTVDALLGVRL